jgi:methyl-accepting chemotaxis protein
LILNAGHSINTSTIGNGKKMKKLTWNQKLGSMIAVLWLGLAAVGSIGAWQNRSSMIDDRRDQLKALVAEGIGVTTHFYSLAQNKTMSEDEAKKRALEALASMRYGEDGYLAVSDSKSTMIMHPLKPAMNGKNFADLTDPLGNKIAQKIVEVAQSSAEGGFVTYVWAKSGSDKPVQKLSYSRRFVPWDWFVTTGMYTDDIDAVFYASAVRWFAITAMLGVLTSLVMLLVLRSIKRELGGDPAIAVSAAQRIACGDLTTLVPLSNGDLNSLMFALNEMQIGLAKTVTRVQTGTENINVGASQIAAGNSDLSQRTEQQAAALVQTASSMEEITANVKQNGDNATHAARLAGEAAEVAHRGNGVVEQVIYTMTRITESSERISDIIGVIDGIAFQTNILALNAAVEAARAGEQGRGFAVVAAEVRSLAQRSASAAKEIKMLIETSTETVNKGASLVSNAGATMTEIVSSVRRVKDILDEISHASQEQYAGIEQVNRAVGEMEQVTQQNAALVEEAAAAAVSLKDQVAVLREATSSFLITA